MNISRTDMSRLAEIEILFTDIDDTFSTRGRITREAYAALWSAREAGLDVAPVTGRPAGWCDHIARMWPVRGVVGENGGLYFYFDGASLHKTYIHDAATREFMKRRIESIRDEILATVPGCAVASDQPYREYDLAIDYCEDVEPLPMSEVRRIVSVFEKHGANVKVSSVHVNGWFGKFDKLSMTKRFAREVCGIDVDSSPERVAFAGDSPNDEPMFAFFPLTFGVANISQFLPDLYHHPAFLADEEYGAGFAEIVSAILDARKARRNK